jgi:hypothetical protein
LGVRRRILRVGRQRHEGRGVREDDRRLLARRDAAQFRVLGETLDVERVAAAQRELSDRYSESTPGLNC